MKDIRYCINQNCLNFFHHCFFRWKIRIGVSKLDDDRSAITLDVKNQTIHPNYDRETLYFDLSVWETEEIELSTEISPVCLPMHKLKNRNELFSLFLYFSFCNLTHSQASVTTSKIIQKLLPNLFQDDLLCAGSRVGNQGPCRGDSGGPIMIQDLVSQKWTQIGMVAGGVRDCGDPDYPEIYTRLNHPAVLNFINSVVYDGKF